MDMNDLKQAEKRLQDRNIPADEFFKELGI